MDYRLNLFTKNAKFFKLEISFKDLDTTTYNLSLDTLRDKNGTKILDHRRNAYQLVVNSPIALDTESMQRIYNEVKRSVKGIFEITPRYVDIVTQSRYPHQTFTNCFEQFGRNILCSNYPSNEIQDVLDDYIDTKDIKRLNYEGDVVKLIPEQEVFRLTDIRLKDTFPSVHCVLKNDCMDIFENILDHKRDELTVYIIHDDYVSLSAHVGYIQTYDNLIVWFVSGHILIPNLNERQRHFDPIIKCMTKINTSNLLERFQEVLKALNFITVSVAYNKSIYSYESQTLVFIGEFPGDAVTIDIKEKYLSCIQNEPTEAD